MRECSVHSNQLGDTIAGVYTEAWPVGPRTSAVLTVQEYMFFIFILGLLHYSWPSKINLIYFYFDTKFSLCYTKFLLSIKIYLTIKNFGKKLSKR